MGNPSWLPAEWLAQAALGGGLLLLMGAIAMLCTRRPAQRQRLAEFALAGSLLVALLAVFAGWLPFTIPLWDEEPQSVDPTVVSSAPPIEILEPPVYLALTLNVPTNDSVISDSLPGGDARLPVELGATENKNPVLDESVSLSPTSAIVPAAESAPSWWTLTATGYLIVATALLLWCVIGHVGLWRLAAKAKPAPARVAAIFAELTRQWPAPPRLGVTPRVAGPVSFGLWRPTILVPPWFCRKHNEDELRQVIVHELTHLERRDAWSCLLLVLVQAVYFYLPWFWWLRRQVRLCQEYIADAAAASLTSSEDYAQYLVSLSAYRPRPVAGVRVTGVLGSSSDLFRRIAMLCNASDRVERQCPRWWTLLVAGGFGLSAILLSGVSLHAQEKKEKVIRVEEKQIDGEAGKPIRLKVEAGGGKEPVILRLEDGKIIQGDRTIRAIVNDEGVIGEAVIVVGDDGDPKTKEVQKKALVELQEALDRATKAAHSDKGLDEARRQLEVAQKRLAEAQKQLEEAKTRVVKPYVNVPTRVKANEALLKLHDGDLADQIRKALEASKKDLESLPAEQRDMVRKRLEEALQHIEENAKKNPKLHKPDGLVPKKTDKELIIHKGEPIKDLLVKPSETGKYILRADGVASGKGRLGIMTDAVPPAVLHHLDLPIGKGLMIVQVLPDTPAAKAGLKEHDIVVQFAGKDVPPDSEAFRKIVVDHKGGPVDVIVLRKGKSTTIKGIGLSEATEGKKLFKEEIEKSLKDKKDFHFKVEPIKKLELEGFKKFDKIDVGDLKKLEWVKAGAGAGGAKSVTTSVIRKDDHLDITHKEDGVTLSINADIEGGKVRINGIGVEEGSSAAKYKSLSEVPEKHRAKVKELLEMGEKGQVRTEIKSKGVR